MLGPAAPGTSSLRARKVFLFCAVGAAVAMLMFIGCGGQPSDELVATPATAVTSPVPTIAVPSTAPPTPTAIAVAKPATPALPAPTVMPAPPTKTGADVLVDQDLAPLHGQRVGLIAHRASVVDGRPLPVWIDEHPLVELTALFAPEHGLYGTADAGASIDDAEDPQTQTPVYSLYGADRAPTAQALADVDVLVYDLQDVGVRFYTYTSTLGLAMQAAAKAGVAFMVLDRPNPLGADRTQGPTLAAGLESFIGMYPVPSAYGLTAGELALLVKAQALVPGLDDLDLTIVPMENWHRSMRWADTGIDWIPPSPNLPTADSALVYPGTVLFEATSISEGRGTDEPFTLIGAQWVNGPDLAREMNARGLAGVRFEAATFTPRSIPGAAESPRFVGEQLSGVRIQVTDSDMIAGVEVGLVLLDAFLRQAERSGIDAAAVIDRPAVFDRLAGNSTVRTSLIAGIATEDILDSFVSDGVDFAELARGVFLYD